MEKGFDRVVEPLLELIGNEHAAETLINLDWDHGADVVKHIPLVGAFVSATRLGLGIREWLFIRKLTTFLVGLEDVPERKRTAFYERLQRDPRLRDRLGTRLMILLDRLDDMDKPDFVARAFQAFMLGDIDLETLHRIWIALDRCAVADFRYLRSFVGERSDLPAPAASAFYSTGLTQLGGLYPVADGGSINNFRLSDFGQLFVDVVLVDTER